MTKYFSNELVSEQGALASLGDTVQNIGKTMDGFANFLPAGNAGGDVWSTTAVAVGGALKAADAAFNGEFLKSGKLMVKAAVEAAVAFANGATLGVVNIGSKLFTGKGLITHAGDITASVLDIGQGATPQVSHMAGIGGGQAFMAATPREIGHWESKVAAERGARRPTASLPPDEAARWAARVDFAQQQAALQGQSGPS